MGLTFEKLEAVKFGDFTAQPKGTMELKLRLQTAIKKASNKADNDSEALQELAETLPKFFPDKEEDVKRFIEETMTVDGMAVLAAYLIGGQNAVEKATDALNGGANES